MNQRSLSAIDWWIALSVLLLVGVSLTTLSSLNGAYFRSQLVFLLVSLGVFFFFVNLNLKTAEAYTIPIYIASIFLLLVILIIGIESHGAVRWIDLFGLRIQFSEILKPFLSFALASYLARQKPTFGTLLKVLLFAMPIVFLVYRQPDLGNALIFIFALLFTLFTFGFSWIWFVVGFVALTGAVPFLWHMLHDYQQQRIITFFNPTNDPLGSSYNAMQSVIAVGSGMVFGKGIGEGTQSGLRFLPERHTDFIFATLSEKFGFVAGAIVIAAFAILLYRIYVIYSLSHEITNKLFCIATFFFLLIQLFVNIGMNIGLLPITGVTLPLISYGGSSLLATFIFLGVVCSIGKTVKNAHILEIR